MSSIGILLIGAVTLLSLFWQYTLFTKLFPPSPSHARQVLRTKAPSKGNRAAGLLFTPPAVVGGTIMIGVLMYSVFLMLDPAKTHFGFLSLLAKLFFAAAFFAILMLKTAFGPMISGFVTSYSIYQYFEYGIFKIWPVMEWIVSLIIEAAPKPIVLLYTLLFLVGSAALSGIAAVTD